MWLQYLLQSHCCFSTNWLELPLWCVPGHAHGRDPAWPNKRERERDVIEPHDTSCI